MATNIPPTAPRVDTRLGKFSQALTILLTVLAFLVNLPWLTLVTALIMVLSALVPAISPYTLLYRWVAVPAKLIQPRVVEDDPAPHRFAQGIGAAFLLASWAILSFTPFSSLGWTLDLIVTVLAGINFFVGFCAGCFVYYHLGRLGILPKVRYEGGFHWRGA